MMTRIGVGCTYMERSVCVAMRHGERVAMRSEIHIPPIALAECADAARPTTPNASVYRSVQLLRQL
jgi:hypothetical protein